MFLDAMTSHCVSPATPPRCRGRNPFLLGALYVYRATANRFLALGHRTLKSQLVPKAAMSHPRTSTLRPDLRAASGSRSLIPGSFPCTDTAHGSAAPKGNHPSRCSSRLESAVTPDSLPVHHSTSESPHRSAAPKANHPSRCARSLESAVTLGSFPVRHPTSESTNRSAAPKGNHPSRCARRLESAVTLGSFPVRHPTSESAHRAAAPKGKIILHDACAAWSQP